MIIVSGWIRLRAGQRDRFLEDSRLAMVQARQTTGCKAFVVAADPIEEDLVNILEHWESEEALLAFRGEGPSSDLQDMITGANVQRHNIASSAPA
ncbi:MAG: putative quinol monooxygenase [Devosia sp.]